MTNSMPCDELRFVHDSVPGVSRRRAGRGFSYVDAEGRRITDGRMLARIRKLAVPPAWQHVWICPDARGHIQAVGWDIRGRKQYRYHDRWREERDREKFARLGDFGKALPTIREAVDAELVGRAMNRERVLAGVIALLDRTLMRVGTPRYAAENQSFGLTTLRNSHATVTKGRIVFSYRGKSGVRQRTVVSDRKLARLVQRCQELPGQTLFQWVDDEGDLRAIGSADVNDYLRGLTDADFTAKDFRTWGASTCVAGHLAAIEDEPASERMSRQVINAAVDEAAQLLGNTRAVCRSSYVHPIVVEAFRDGRLLKAAASPAREIDYLSRDETLLLDLL